MNSDPYSVFYSINSIDSDGEVEESGIFLHFGGTRVRVSEDRDGWDRFLMQIKLIDKQIQEDHRIL